MALPDTPASAEFRRELLASGWLDEDAASQLLGISPGRLRELREERAILGVWASDEEGYLYPTFQFNRGSLVALLPEILECLPKGNGSGWSEAMWFHTPKALLKDRLPSDVLLTDPILVLEAATAEARMCRIT